MAETPGDTADLQPLAALEVSAQLQTIQQLGSQLPSSDCVASRKALRDAALELAGRLETPEDAFNTAFFQPALPVAILVAIEAGWMQQLCDKGTPMTTDSLATATNTGSRSTCLRVMRVLVAHRIVTEAGTECFCANNRSRFLILPAVQSGIRHLYPLSAEATLHIPSWMASNRYREPVSVAEGPFASRFGKTFWDVLREEPERHVAFSASMESVYEEHVIDKDADIVWEAIADGMDAAQPHHEAMLVDIGGAKGHLVRTIQKRHKPVGRLVLQDRASTVASIAADALPGVTVSAYDFFAPQPERGARAYCLRHILHDWPDERCREILRNVVDAMTHGYSKLLVLDMMLPDTGCGAESAMSDLMLLAVFCGKERSRRQFQELFASVGLVMQKATMSGQGTAEAVIECVLEKAET